MSPLLSYAALNPEYFRVRGLSGIHLGRAKSASPLVMSGRTHPDKAQGQRENW
jgi:hypothetical protein